VGTDTHEIKNALENSEWPNERPSIYGQGNAADQIIEILLE
jgi:hypothetical protein